MFVHNSLTTFRNVLQLEMFSFECSFEEFTYFLNKRRWSLPQVVKQELELQRQSKFLTETRCTNVNRQLIKKLKPSQVVLTP